MKTEIDKKNATIAKLKGAVEELNDSLVSKNNDCKEIIENFNLFKDEKNREIEELFGENAELAKALLEEKLERQKEKDKFKDNLAKLFNYRRLDLISSK